RWVLGTVAGPANNIVRAVVDDLPAAVFTARADPGPAATLVAAGGNDQTAAVTTPVPTPPAVQVADAWGNPVVGATVRFTPDDGYVTAQDALSDATGTASTGWVLGPVAGEQHLRASLMGDLPLEVAFRATGTGSAALCSLPAGGSGFDIHLCPLAPLDATAEAALGSALARWRHVVVGDLLDVAPPPDHTTCLTAAPWLDGTVDDLVLYVEVSPLDGVGGALAGAAPCSVRAESGLPLIARLRVDRDDVEPLAAAGQLVDVLTHEIGHALGIGTLWGAFGLLRDPAAGSSGPPPDTWFAGTQATQAFDDAGGSGRTVGPKVPVQNRGGGGVVDLHWRETVFGAELMTAELDAGVPNPLSAITVSSLADLGYVVDVNRSDPFVVPFPNFPTHAPMPPRRLTRFP
ncbi:MAG: hypothetical protein KJP18_14580, partial [Gemmatimonadetes bacterium]|nr:hypothetical protein [Gemmatimonadota bacterium]